MKCHVSKPSAGWTCCSAWLQCRADTQGSCVGFPCQLVPCSQGKAPTKVMNPPKVIRTGFISSLRTASSGSILPFVGGANKAARKHTSKHVFTYVMRVLTRGSAALSHYRAHASGLNIPLVKGGGDDCIP